MFSRNVKTRTMRALRIIPGLALPALLSAPALDAQARDFLLRTPQVTLSLKGGYSVPRLGGGGDPRNLWDEIIAEQTLDRADFAGPHATLELGVRTSERLDIVVSVGYSASSVTSEYRDFDGDDGLPITQTTDFTTLPLLAGIKAYLLPRGRSIGSYAWVPRAFNAYAGVAGGMVWYRFQQRGEFVDYQTYDIFLDNLKSVESAPIVNFFAGTEISVNKRVVLAGEGSYGFAKGPLQVYYDGSSDFEGYSKLDLSGLKLSVGLGLRI